jgi:hypothetical protein
VWGLSPHNQYKGGEKTMKKYTLKQIMKMWKQLYGENFKTEYSGFYNLLKKGK